MDLMPLGKRLKEARENRRWSLREVARRAGTSDSYLGSLEKGRMPGGREHSRPSVGWLRQVAAALDIDPAELFELAGYDQDAVWEKARAERGPAAGPLVISADSQLDELRRRRPAAARYVEGLIDQLLNEDPE